MGTFTVKFDDGTVEIFDPREEGMLGKNIDEKSVFAFFRAIYLFEGGKNVVSVTRN